MSPLADFFGGVSDRGGVAVSGWSSRTAGAYFSGMSSRREGGTLSSPVLWWTAMWSRRTFSMAAKVQPGYGHFSWRARCSCFLASEMNHFLQVVHSILGAWEGREALEGVCLERRERESRLFVERAELDPMSFLLAASTGVARGRRELLAFDHLGEEEEES